MASRIDPETEMNRSLEEEKTANDISSFCRYSVLPLQCSNFFGEGTIREHLMDETFRGFILNLKNAKPLPVGSLTLPTENNFGILKMDEKEFTVQKEGHEGILKTRETRAHFTIFEKDGEIMILFESTM
jgi:hypothetical protein